MGEGVAVVSRRKPAPLIDLSLVRDARSIRLVNEGAQYLADTLKMVRRLRTLPRDEKSQEYVKTIMRKFDATASRYGLLAFLNERNGELNRSAESAQSRINRIAYKLAKRNSTIETYDADTVISLVRSHIKEICTELEDKIDVKAESRAKQIFSDALDGGLKTRLEQSHFQRERTAKAIAVAAVYLGNVLEGDEKTFLRLDQIVKIFSAGNIPVRLKGILLDDAGMNEIEINRRAKQHVAVKRGFKLAKIRIKSSN